MPPRNGQPGAEYRRNHYVPEWYQKRFIASTARERKFHYLDLMPETFLDPTGRQRTKTALRRWGPDRCFFQTDLYTLSFGGWESTEIEEKFFGRIDHEGRPAIDYFSNFTHPSVDGEALEAATSFMSIQKLRTPKGLAYLGKQADFRDRNGLILAMANLRHLHRAHWYESIWQIADASQSPTKFIISDHPVTVYNKACFPGSRWCLHGADPETWLSGTHTIFPLDLNKVLILTNLSWVRNPYGDGDLLPVFHTSAD